jgi:3-hydroxybutyryl-CoA dehydrogenase
MSTIAVIGAGVMGADVTLNLAAFGHSVILKDIDKGVLQAFKDSIPRQLRGYRMLGWIPEHGSAAEVGAHIHLTDGYDGIADADWVVENVTEDWDTKKSVYQDLGRICKPEVYFAVNTSCIPITKIAALMPCPDHVVGAHFMNPVPLMKIVEVVRGYHTSDETLDQMKRLLSSIGKTGIVVKDSAGFVSNRLSHLFMNEAAFLVQDGIAKPVEIDAIFKQGYGHKMGPLETADLIGLDTVVKSLDVLYQYYQDTKFRCCPLLRQMVDAGDIGKKSGRGFYEYRA